MDLNAGGGGGMAQVFNQLHLAFFQILAGVEIFHVGGRDVEAEIGPKVLKIVVVRQLVIHRFVQRDGCLVSLDTKQIFFIKK